MADSRLPHISRIYEYVLGGGYKYEVDRDMAELLMARVPSYPRWARQNRAFLGEVGDLWASEGRQHVLDLGSGLPSQGHFNARIPDAKILFSDIDAETVAEGSERLAENPQMSYVEADISDPRPLLEHAAAFFGSERRLSVGLIGVAYFIDDEALRRLAHELHAFCAPGSVLAFTFPTNPEGRLSDEVLADSAKMAKQAQIELSLRTIAEFEALLEPWRVLSTRRLEDPPNTTRVPDGVEDPFGSLFMCGGLCVRD